MNNEIKINFFPVYRCNHWCNCPTNLHSYSCCYSSDIAVHVVHTVGSTPVKSLLDG